MDFKKLFLRQIYGIWPWLVFLLFFIIWRSTDPEIRLRLASDDSYIYLGYVKMTITHPYQLFAYNLAEHSAGTTGIGYYYLLILVCFLVKCSAPFLSLPNMLIFGMQLLNDILFILIARTFVSVWYLLPGNDDGRKYYVLVLLSVLFFAHPDFIWGIFAGMENPLTCLLCLIILKKFLAGASNKTIAIFSALLGIARPELTPIGFLIMCFSVIVKYNSYYREKRNISTLLKTATWSLGIFISIITASILPCYISTGRYFPSALGSRVHLNTIFDSLQVWKNIGQLPNILISEQFYWFQLSLVLFLISLALLVYDKKSKPVFIISIFLIINFGFRLFAGLSGFNIRDRYISFIWPLLALGFATTFYPVWCIFIDAIQKRFKETWVLAICAVLLGIGIFIPAKSFTKKYALDVREMNDVVVMPAQWINENLPKNSRIAMEPAGAIRVFSDVYLIDAVGLTTQHVAKFYDNYYDFLLFHQAEYTFDYPGRIPELEDTSKFEKIKEWTPRRSNFSLGKIGLYRILGGDDKK